MSAQSSSQALRPRSIVAEISGILIPLLILGGGIGVFAASIINRPEQKKQPETETIPTVRTVTAVPFQDEMIIDVDGVVVPHREIQLPTEVSGRIIRRAEHCRAGKYVRAGDVLFEVDPLDYELEVKRLQQEQQQAQQRIEETKVDIANTLELRRLAEADLKLQQNDVERMRRLTTNGAVADADLDRALRAQVTASNALQSIRNRENLLAAQLKSAETTLDLATTKLDVAHLNLKRTKIRSPIDGVVYQERCEVDSFVQKGATLVTIEDTSAVEVLCNLRTDQIRWLWRASADSSHVAGKFELPPARVDVIFRSDRYEHVWQGVVSRYDGIGVDPQTRTVPCRILVSDPTEVISRLANPTFEPESGGSNDTTTIRDGPAVLVRGMFVDVRINVPATDDLLSVPIEAVRPGGKLWVVRDDKLEVRSASIAKTMEDNVLIRRDGTNIHLDDRIIVTPLPAAAEGITVQEKSS